MVHYVGVLDGSGEVWGVRFPDVPGCVGGGASPEEAIEDATTALRDVMAYKRGERSELPKASTVAEVIASGEIGPGETAVLIPLVLDAGRTIRANLTFDAGLLAAIDGEAHRRGLTRSAFLASAAREKLEGRR
ncbi:MAG: type II toxin-antitoxin system HicB family antitoxin [Rhodomicrobium sp.]